METSVPENSSGLGGCQNPDPVLIVPDVWEKLIAEFGVKSVLDVGCGYGHALRWFRDHGVPGFGFEGYRPAVEGSVTSVIQWDFTKGPPILAGTLDLCWCAEFVEHVEARFMPNYLQSFKACRIVAMTHATPGQGGFHHVNEQVATYWIGALNAVGFEFLADATIRLRRPAPYGVNNLLVFRNLK